jgi:hypothetical protein
MRHQQDTVSLAPSSSCLPVITCENDRGHVPRARLAVMRRRRSDLIRGRDVLPLFDELGARERSLPTETFAYGMTHAGEMGAIQTWMSEVDATTDGILYPTRRRGSVDPARGPHTREADRPAVCCGGFRCSSRAPDNSQSLELHRRGASVERRACERRTLPG